jgi:tetratricopeptide (TPR) repeat protein
VSDEGAPFTPENEALWETLSTQLDWADAFWLGFLFSDHWPMTEAFRARLERRLIRDGRVMDTLRFESPEQATPLLTELIGEPAPAERLTWLAVELDEEQGPNASAALLARINERRERLKRHRPGGVVLALPARWRDDLLVACPDLWTVRSFELEPVPPPAEGAIWTLPPRIELPSAPPGDAEADRAMLAKAEAKGDVVGQATALLRLAEREGAARRFGEAMRLARAAKGLLGAPGAPRQLSKAASSLMGSAAFAMNDMEQARAHLREAFALREEPPDTGDLSAVHDLLQVGLVDRRGAPDVEKWAKGQVLKGRPRSREEEEHVADLLTALATLAQQRGEGREVTTLTKEAARLYRGLLLVAPTRDELKVQLARANALLASVALAEGRHADVIKLMHRERRALLEVLSRAPSDAHALRQLSIVVCSLMVALGLRGRGGEAGEVALTTLQRLAAAMDAVEVRIDPIEIHNVGMGGAELCLMLLQSGLSSPLREQLLGLGLTFTSRARAVPGPASSRLAELERQLRALPPEAPPR